MAFSEASFLTKREDFESLPDGGIRLCPICKNWSMSKIDVRRGERIICLNCMVVEETLVDEYGNIIKN